MTVQKVFAYRNLHKKCWSLKQGGKVFAHAQWAMLGANIDPGKWPRPMFRVNEKGRDRVLREKRKNVHAFAVGYTVDNSSDPGDQFFLDLYETVKTLPDFRRVSYNPYKSCYFVTTDTDAPVMHADFIFLTPFGLFAYNPDCRSGLCG